MGHCHPLLTPFSWSVPRMLVCQHSHPGSLDLFVKPDYTSIDSKAYFCHGTKQPIPFIAVNQIMAKREPGMQLLALSFGLHCYASNLSLALCSFPDFPFILISLSIYFILNVFFYKQLQISFGSKCRVSTNSKNENKGKGS